MEQTILNSWERARVEEAIHCSITLKNELAVFETLKPTLTKDGNQWCCLYGILPEPSSIVGFGHSPAVAISNFYVAYNK